MTQRRLCLLSLPLLALCLLLSSCGRGEPVRHLASDVSLVIQGQSTRADVEMALGPPDESRIGTDGREEWIYREVHRSLLRKTPYVGGHLGDQEEEVVVVTFEGDRVRTCVYRVDGEDRTETESP
ncbi:MAG: hypothetical protein AB1634_11280 [Thermodesulfobacteriota bacterium]